MKIVCPCCATGFPIEAGLLEGDAKRLAKLLGDMEPVVARAAMSYLRMFKPAKHELRVQRAILILIALAELMITGRVSRDNRTGMYRPCTSSLWVQGIEQMLTHTNLELPLKNHNYLRTIVFALADSADAKAEVQREKDRKQHRGSDAGLTPIISKRDAHIAWAQGLLDRGIFDKAKFDAEVQVANHQFGSEGKPS